MRKHEAEFVEQLVRSLSEQHYWGLVHWLAGGCNGSLWSYVQPAKRGIASQKGVSAQNRVAH
jgi:hypothetical protein